MRMMIGFLAIVGVACGSSGDKKDVVKRDGGVVDMRAPDSNVSVDMGGGSDSAATPDRPADTAPDGQPDRAPDQAPRDMAAPDSPADTSTAADTSPAADAADDASPADMSMAADSSSSDASGGSCVIPCFIGVVDQCIPSGTCMTQSNAGTGSNTCWMNGVKILTTVSGLTSNTKITKTDGTSTCWTIDSATTISGMTATTTFTYKNSGGTAIATGMVTGSTTTITCTGSGVTYDLARDCPSGNTSGGSSCSMGTCTP